jgi:hypothetical protein
VINSGPHIYVAELTTLIYTATIRNQTYLLFWISKIIFIVLFLLLYLIFYVGCFRGGIMVVYKLIFQYFILVLCKNNLYFSTLD